MAPDDAFEVQLIDSTDWVPDHVRNLCYVCTRPFGSFRRKHHCRMCGEVVCNNCTLLKRALEDPTVGSMRVRVCMSCVISCSNQCSEGVQNAPLCSVNTTFDVSNQLLKNDLGSLTSSSLSEPDSEDMSLSLKSLYALNLTYDHYKEESDDRNARKRNFQTEPQSSGPWYKWNHPWPCPPVSVYEVDRLRALHALKVLDSESEQSFDLICDLAKTRLSCPMAAVSFLDEHRQWFKASVGLAHKMIPRKMAFCAYTVYACEPMVVLDTLQDTRLQQNPLVVGAAGIRFYAAAPIIDPNSGYAVGSVFVLDTRPREACDVSILERLALALGQNFVQIASDAASFKSVCQSKVALDNNAHDKALRQESHKLAHIIPIKEPLSIGKIGTSTSSSSGGLFPLQISMASSRLDKDVDRSLAMKQQRLMGAPAAGEQMEILLMRLLTQNTETQEQLALQQILISKILGEHTIQLNKLMTAFARMEAKVKARSERQEQ
ncbi:hypothetical protein CCR75_007196 [Bremia lactucae]|uniref:FYVE-type domain-containing protein n=1 Tax=Bremia lactucae TaxID=4779 RepID=A0A976FFI0_BRELC|nr:hypothetical protein CCR75_007196 [Bremia lactucae]